MQTHAFREWLRTQYLQVNGQRLAIGTQVSRSANCSTIEEWEGDLDSHFELDGMKTLLEKLSYSRADQAQKLDARHRIPIDGDISNGSTTYRSAANLYRKFRIAQQNGFILPELSIAENVQTETLRSVKTRIGQDRFRYMVLERWDYRCAATGAALLLSASHIKPWRFSSNLERLDSINGICLSPLYDKAFDMGMITFRCDGMMILSPTVRSLDAALLGLTKPVRLKGLGERHRPYLDFHHQTIWKHCGQSVNDPGLCPAA